MLTREELYAINRHDCELKSLFLACVYGGLYVNAYTPSGRHAASVGDLSALV